MQVLRRPVQRVRLNQDYGLIRLEEVVVERVRTHDENSMCYTQPVSPVSATVVIRAVWLGDETGASYSSIRCGQDKLLWFHFNFDACYVKKLTFECYAGKDTGWENLIKKEGPIDVDLDDDCYYDNYYSMLVPESGEVKDFLKKAGLDCKAEQVKVCGKIICE